MHFWTPSPGHWQVFGFSLWGVVHRWGCLHDMAAGLPQSEWYGKGERQKAQDGSHNLFIIVQSQKWHKPQYYHIPFLQSESLCLVHTQGGKLCYTITWIPEGKIIGGSIKRLPTTVCKRAKFQIYRKRSGQIRSLAHSTPKTNSKWFKGLNIKINCKLILKVNFQKKILEDYLFFNILSWEYVY